MQAVINAKIGVASHEHGIDVPVIEADHDLLAQVATGDVEAFELLFQRYRPRVSRFATRLTTRRDIVEEVVNDTLMVVWQKAGSFRGEARLSSWILGIAYRITLKKLRQSSRRAEEKLPDAEKLADFEEPETLLSRRQSREQVRRALERLTPEHRAVVELTFFDGLSYREIAQIVGCPQNTVKTRMFHARKRLKRLLTLTRPSARITRRPSDA